MPFGFWGSDTAGKVIHYEPAGGDPAPFQKSEVVGRDFFSDVMPAAQAEHLRIRPESFMSGPAPAQSIDFTLQYGQGGVRAGGLPGRAHEGLAVGAAESIPVHLKRA